MFSCTNATTNSCLVMQQQLTINNCLVSLQQYCSSQAVRRGLLVRREMLSDTSQMVRRGLLVRREMLSDTS